MASLYCHIHERQVSGAGTFGSVVNKRGRQTDRHTDILRLFLILRLAVKKANTDTPDTSSRTVIETQFGVEN